MCRPSGARHSSAGSAQHIPQRGIDARWQVVPAWTRASILNVARMPWFSSDRTIREYAQDIWNVPVRGTLPQASQEPGAQREATR